jgi:soluble lytic murein transglycosylase
MELKGPLIRTGHPPHSVAKRKDGFAPSRILFKVALFVFIFILSFHLPGFPHGIKYLLFGTQGREQTIQEILGVLERHQTGLANVTKEPLAEVIYEEATRYNYDPKFILALIAIESSFHNWSVSEQGAKGLMQIMPYVAESVAKELGIEWSGDRTLFNPFLNIKMGVHYLSRLLLDFKDPELAVTAYNYGPTYVKGLIDGKRKVPQDFYQKIATMYHDLIASTNRNNTFAPEDEQLTELL